MVNGQVVGFFAPDPRKAIATRARGQRPEQQPDCPRLYARAATTSRTVGFWLRWHADSQGARNPPLKLTAVPRKGMTALSCVGVGSNSSKKPRQPASNPAGSDQATQAK